MLQMALPVCLILLRQRTIAVYHQYIFRIFELRSLGEIVAARHYRISIQHHDLVVRALVLAIQPHCDACGSHHRHLAMPHLLCLLAIGDQPDLNAAMMRRDQRLCNAIMRERKGLHQYLMSRIGNRFNNQARSILTRRERHFQTATRRNRSSRPHISRSLKRQRHMTEQQE